MKYSVDKREKYTLIQLNEEKLDSTIAPSLKSEFVNFNAEGVRNLIIDLSNVRYADSSGLSALLVGNRVCTDSNGVLVIIAINEPVEKMIKISQLDSVLNILPTVEEAIDAVFMNDIENELRSENLE